MHYRSTMNVKDEIDFWSRQLSEHALFLNLGLDDPSLKKRADRLHTQWEVFRSGTRAPKDAIALALLTRELLSEVYSRLTAGEWLGWIWPLFVDHIRREGDYFISKLQGTAISTPTECGTWLQFMAEHAAFAAHLLDPVEVAKIRQATKFIGDFETLHGGCAQFNTQLQAMSERAGKALDAYFTTLGVGTANVQSIIHPVLAEHVVREGRRFLKVIATLGPSNGARTFHEDVDAVENVDY